MSVEHLEAVAKKARTVQVAGEEVILSRPSIEIHSEFDKFNQLLIASQEEGAITEALNEQIDGIVAKCVSACTGVSEDVARDLLVEVGVRSDLAQKSVRLCGGERSIGVFVAPLKRGRAEQEDFDDRPF